jgi:hypothetical protein
MQGALSGMLAAAWGTTALVVVAIGSVATVVLIVVAPWKQVRDEPPIDPTAEAKLLLHQDPDEPTGEFGAVTPLETDEVDEIGIDEGDPAGLDDLA